MTQDQIWRRSTLPRITLPNHFKARMYKDDHSEKDSDLQIALLQERLRNVRERKAAAERRRSQLSESSGKSELAKTLAQQEERKLKQLEAQERQLDKQIEAIEFKSKEQENGNIKSANEESDSNNNLTERMNTHQRIAIMVGLSLILLMLLIPPWSFVGGSSVGYHFIFAPPRGFARIDTVRLTVQCIFIALLIGGVVFFTGLYIRISKNDRRERISNTLSDLKLNLLAHWKYTPSEWKRAVEEEFTWVKNKEIAGQIYISPTTIYITNGHDNRIIVYKRKGEIVTHASYRGADSSPLKIRVRWKVITKQLSGGEVVNYFSEDYRIPVPCGCGEEAKRIVDYFTTSAEKNLGAILDVTPPDASISLFGREPFD